jgi:myo-inositol-1(or 4)-monophosphatase
VIAPSLRELWHAARGAGAVWEPPGGPPRVAHVSERSAAQAVVGTGFPFRHEELRPRYLGAFAAALETFEDLRRPGAASLDLAWVASGVFDGFFELGLEPWDVAAGGLLIEEAGGTVTDWDGTPAYLGGNILAGSPRVHAELLRIASSTI